jgi:hypothetical protein
MSPKKSKKAKKPKKRKGPIKSSTTLPGNCPPWPFLDGLTAKQKASCKKNEEDENTACKDKDADACCKDEACQKARKCMLLPYHNDDDRTRTCCPGQSGHHLVEVHGFTEAGKGGRKRPLPEFKAKRAIKATATNPGRKASEAYSQHAAPCVCASSPKSNWEKEHGDLHAVQGIKENAAIEAVQKLGGDETRAWTYGEARDAGLEAHAATFPASGCDEDCLKLQLDRYHQEKVGVDDSTSLRTKPYGQGTEVRNYENGLKMDQLSRGEYLLKRLEALGEGFPLEAFGIS